MDKEVIVDIENPKDNDLISRQAVISTIYDNKSDFKNDFTQGFFTDKVRDLPSVNPTKTGHREYNDIYDHYLCGNCKTVVMDYDNYCPNCGARMVEPQERREE